MGKKKTIGDFLEMKKRGEKTAGLVNYIKPFAILAEKAEADWLLGPGDSVGPSYLEYDDTVPVTEEIIKLFAKAVRKGAPNTLRVWDLTFGSYATPADAVASAIRAHKESGVSMVKLEGGRNVTGQIQAIVENGMKVMGHIGLTPQTAGFSEGYVVHGLTAESAMKVISDAKAIEEAGVSAILVEAVTAEVGQIITKTLKIPVFGIGAGPFVDGQLLLDVDVLGLSTVFNPTFIKCFVPQAVEILIKEGGVLNLANITLCAFKEYVREVKAETFPAKEHCYHMKPGEETKLVAWLKKAEEKKREEEKIPDGPCDTEAKEGPKIKDDGEFQL